MSGPGVYILMSIRNDDQLIEAGKKNLNVLEKHSGTVVSTAASQCQGPWFDSQLGSLSVWSLHILPVSV